MEPLPQSFYDRDVVLVARDLLGKLLVRRSGAGTGIGRIVEVEAYLSAGDPACHASRGRTRKNATMFGRPGKLYVYSIHARYCMNVVTEPRGTASAVLIRAVKPLQGLDLMQRRRGTDQLLDLGRGPARLCEALDVDRRLDDWDLCRGQRIWITADGASVADHVAVGVSPRIGVTSNKEAELRFFMDGSPFVSGPRRVHSRPLAPHHP